MYERRIFAGSVRPGGAPARARIRQIKGEIAQSKQAVARFEWKYGVTLTRFESDVLPEADTFEVHEEYQDWFYWQSVPDEKQKLLSDLETLELT